MFNQNNTNNTDREDLALLQHYGESADLYILAAVARDRNFWRTWSSIICLEPKKLLPNGSPGKPEHCDDFSNPVDNAIYVAIHQTQLGIKVETGEMVSNSLVTHSLQMMIKRGVMMSETELPIALQRVQTICGPSVPADVMTVANRLIKPWVTNKRAARLNTKLNSSRVGLASVREELNRVVAHIESGELKDTAVAAGFDMETEKMDIRPCYDVVSPGMSRLLGGGFRKGDASLCIAAQGVGKTIHFAQCSMDLFLRHKLKVLAITTEQDARQIELRHASREATIPFKKLAGGFDASLLNPEELAAYRSYRTHVQAAAASGGCLETLHWQKAEQGLHEKLEDIIRRYRDKMGGLDAITLDWLGGAMGLTNEMVDNKRGYMQLLADVFCVKVNDYNLVGVAYAQARAVTKEGYDNWYVCSGNMQDNKSLGNNFTNTFGMSGMQDTSGGPTQSGSAPLFQVVQNYFVSKSRKGEGGSCRFSRARYSYQKLVDVA
jgi:hypothetical protein